MWFIGWPMRRIKKALKKKKREYPKCSRCGVCCLMGPCVFGNEDGLYGICRHLVIHYSGNTACTLMLEGAAARYHLLSGGCNIRQLHGDNEVYKQFSEMAADRKDALYEHQHPGRDLNHDRKMWDLHTL